MRRVGIGGGLLALGSGALVGWAMAAQPALAQQWPVAPPQPRPVGSITAQCGGGITGGGGGTRIMADGTVTRLEQPRAGVPLVQTPLGRDWEAYRRWVAVLEAADFARQAEQRPGNVTCSLTQDVGGRLIGASWPGEAPPSRVPAGVRQVFMELRNWSPPE